MPLDDGTLRTDILDIIDGTVDTSSVTLAGGAWGTAYDDYSKTATTPAGIVVPGASKTTLQAALVAAFSVLPGVPATVAGAVTSAFDVYWPTATFPGQTGPPLPTGSAVLITTLTTVFSLVLTPPAPGSTHGEKATVLRDAFAAYTKLVGVPFPGPSTVFVA